MRLAVQLLDNVESVNTFSPVTQMTIVRGETKQVYFQLVDHSKKDLRYVPLSGASVKFQITRNQTITGTINNVRQISDNSINKVATQAFAGDASIWKVSLSSAETQLMTSGGFRVLLNEGAVTSIAISEMSLIIAGGDC